MAKFAVLFLAALAFQAASAGVRRTQGTYGGYGSYKGGYGQLENLVGQIQTVTGELSSTFQNTLPNNRQVYKTIIYQSREFAQYIDEVINRLQSEVSVAGGSATTAFQQVIGQLRQVQTSLEQTASYTDLASVGQLKAQFHANIQNVVELLEKLVRIVESDYQGSQGSLYAVVKGVLVDFLNGVQGIQSHTQFIGQRNYIGQGSVQVAQQIREVTGGLLNALQATSVGSKQLQYALREYAQNIENIIERLQGQVTIGGSGEFGTIAQEVARKLRQILLCINQIEGVQGTVIVKDLKTELEIQLQQVASVFEQLVQLVQGGVHQTQVGSLVEEIIGEYLTATQQARIQIQGGFLGGYGYQGGVQGLFGLQGGYQGQYQGLQRDFQGQYQGLQRDFQGQYQGPYQSQYQGLYQGLLGKGFFRKGEYGQSGKGLGIQIQAVIGDLSESLQNVVVDNIFVRQVLVNQIRRYVQYLDLIVQRLQGSGTNTYVTEVNGQQIVENLRQIVESLRQIASTGSTVPATELRTQVSLYVQKAANLFEQLTNVYQAGYQQTNAVVKNVIVQFLIATRNLQVQVQNIAYLGQTGQTTRGLGIQIQTLANGVTTGLQSVAIDNKQVREVLAELSREFARDLENIVGRLESAVTYNGVSHNIAGNLRQVIVSLQQIAGFQDYTTAQKLRLQLIVNIQNAVNEIQKLLWAGNYSQVQGYDNTKHYAILNDFAIALQNQQIQLQNVYQTSQYGQSTQQLACQIQGVTNNLAIYLQTARGEQSRQNVIHQIRKLVLTVENVIERLEVEGGYSGSKIALNLKQIVGSLEQVAGHELAVSSVYELDSQLYIVLQNVASELRKLAWIGQYGVQQGEGNLNYLVRSILIQYLVTLQNVQIQVQGIYQTYQIGQSPRELALQIQVVANRLIGILNVAVPETRLTATSLIWQARRLSQIIENIVYRLQGQYAAIGAGKADTVLQQVAGNLQQIQQALEQAVVQTGPVSVRQLKVQLAVYVQDVAVEMQKLIWAAQTELPSQGQGNSLVRNVLVDFLYGLQNLQMQVQNNLQIVLGGQSPRTLVIQIQSVANRIFSFLQLAQQSNSQYLRQTLIIQIGELAQTVENVVNVLQTEVQNNGDYTNVLQEIAAQLTKISKQLQLTTEKQSIKPVEQLAHQLTVLIQNVVVELEKLAYVTQYQYQQQYQGHVGTVLDGAFNNLLATLRNILIQLQNTYQIGQYGQSAKDLSNQIQTVTNTLVNSLQNVFSNTKQVRQDLAIRILKFSSRLQYVVERLQTEHGYYSSAVGGSTLEQIAQNLQQVVVALRQIGQSVVSVTANELRTYLNTQVQNAAAQIQKLLVIQQSQGATDTVVRSVLIEYLAAVQTLQIQIQNVAQRSQKGLTLRQLATQIEVNVFDLSRYLERVVPTNKLAAQTFVVEARELSKVLANIAHKLQTGTTYGVGKGQIQIIFQRVAQQLFQIHTTLQQVTGVQGAGIDQIKIQLAVQIQNAAVAIEELIWTVQPQLQQVQGNTGTIAIVRSALNEFLTVVQSIQIQIRTIVQNGQYRQYSWGLGRQGLQGLQGQVAGLQGSQIGQYGSELEFLGDHIGGYGIQGLQIYQYPRQLVIQIQNLVNEIGAALQSPIGNDQQTIQTLVYQVREFSQIIGNIADQLQAQTGYAYGNGDVVIQQVARRLREIQQTLQQIVGYTTANSVNQLRIEFDIEIQNAAAEIEKLIWIVQQTQGNLDVVVKQVFGEFLTGLQTIQHQIQGIAQVGAFGNLFGQYGQGYGYGGLYGKGYGYGGKYGQSYGYGGKYGQSYGYGGKYGQGLYGYGDKYGQGLYGYGGKYGQGLYGYGKSYARSGKSGQQGYGYGGLYGKGYGYGKLFDQGNQGLQGFGDEYDFEGQYGQGLFGGRYGSVYGNQYGQGYGYQGLYDNENGNGIYGNDYQGLQYGRYGYGYQGIQAQPISELANQVQIVANRVAREFQNVISGNKQINQVLIIQGRQLALIIDNIIDRLQSEIGVGSGNVFGQVIDNLRQIRVQLQQVNRAGFFYGINQIKLQIAGQIQNVADELQKLVYVGQGEYQSIQGGAKVAIKSALAQYLIYLRNVQYQLQSNGLYLQNPDYLASQLQSVTGGVSGYLRDYPYAAQQGGLSTHAREYAQNVADIIDRWQSQPGSGYEGEYVSLYPVLGRLSQISGSILDDSDNGIAELHIRLGDNVRGVADELQNWYRTAQPQGEDSILARGVLGGFLDAAQNLRYRIQDYDY